MGTCLILQAPDNRETGANPVRSRHCKPGAHNHCHVQPLIRSGLGRRLWVLSGKSGNLPVVGTGIIFQITSNWLYRFTVFQPRISVSDGNGFLRRGNCARTEADSIRARIRCVLHICGKTHIRRKLPEYAYAGVICRLGFIRYRLRIPLPCFNRYGVLKQGGKRR